MLIHTSITWGMDEEAPHRAASSAVGSSKLQRCPSFLLPWWRELVPGTTRLIQTQPSVVRKSQAGVPGELWLPGLRMITLVLLPARLGCSSAHHACWLVCIQSSPHGGPQVPP